MVSRDKDQGPGPGTRDQGPGTRDQGPGPGTSDQGPGPGTIKMHNNAYNMHEKYIKMHKKT